MSMLSYFILLSIIETISPTFFMDTTCPIVNFMPNSCSTAAIRLICSKESQSSISSAVVSAFTVISSSSKTSLNTSFKNFLARNTATSFKLTLTIASFVPSPKNPFVGSSKTSITASSSAMPSSLSARIFASSTLFAVFSILF